MPKGMEAGEGEEGKMAQSRGDLHFGKVSHDDGDASGGGPPEGQLGFPKGCKGGQGFRISRIRLESVIALVSLVCRGKGWMQGPRVSAVCDPDPTSEGRLL